MKKAQKKTDDMEMREEYDFSGGVRGKYAKRYAEGTNVVILNPELSTPVSRFQISERSIKIFGKTGSPNPKADSQSRLN